MASNSVSFFAIFSTLASCLAMSSSFSLLSVLVSFLSLVTI